MSDDRVTVEPDDLVDVTDRADLMELMECDPGAETAMYAKARLDRTVTLTFMIVNPELVATFIVNEPVEAFDTRVMIDGQYSPCVLVVDAVVRQGSR